MTANRVRAIVGVIQAVIAFTLVTQSDVVVPPLLKYLLGAASVGFATIDWGAWGISTGIVRPPETEE